MTSKSLFAAVAVAAMLAACSPQAAPTDSANTATQTAATPVAITAPAGSYLLDPTHASLTFRVGHMGLSHYTARFTRFDATLTFDPANPTASSVTATIDPTSVETDYPGDFRATHPDSTFGSWDEELAGDAKFFNAGAHPQITFQSTGLQLTGERSGIMTGDLTFLGQTHPVTLDVTFNGEAQLPWLAGRSAIGFSAVGRLDRSQWGMTYLIPQGGGPGVADSVEIVIEAEFQQAPPADAPAPAAE
jgi:polyisoprenoid-binding protein YceI